MDVTDRSSLPRRPPTSAQRDPLPRTVDGLPPLDPAYGAIVDSGLSQIGFVLDAAARRAIDDHVRLLLAWNAHINLSGLKSVEDIARGHVLDALIAVPFLRSLTNRSRVSAEPSRNGGPSLLDLGSGGGFPGLPIAVALAARRTALVDSIAKKAAFLDAAAAVVGEALRGAPDAATANEPSDITALAERAEDLADEPDQRDSWDLVLARAVGTVAEIAELGLPLARLHGHVVVWKRDSGNGELEHEIVNARRICQAAGGAMPRIVDLEAAARVGLDGHCLVVIRKLRPTPDRYPRPAGERRRAALP